MLRTIIVPLLSFPLCHHSLSVIFPSLILSPASFPVCHHSHSVIVPCLSSFPLSFYLCHHSRSAIIPSLPAFPFRYLSASIIPSLLRFLSLRILSLPSFYHHNHSCTILESLLHKNDTLFSILSSSMILFQAINLQNILSSDRIL